MTPGLNAVPAGRALVLRLPFVAASLIAIQAFVIAYRMRDSALFSDDFFNFMLYQELGFRARYFLRDVFGQFAPGFRLVQALYFDLFGINFLGAQLYIIVLSMASSALVVAIARQLGACRWSIVAFLIIYIFLLQHMHMQLWWSTALHTVSSMVTLLASTYALLRNRRVLSAAIYGVGLCFTAKALFALVPLAGLWCFASPGNLRPWLRTLPRVAEALKFHVALLLIYGVLAARFAPMPAPAVPAGPLVVAQFLGNALVDGTVAATFGLGSQTFSEAQPAAMLLAFAACCVFAGLTIRSDPRNAILWGTLLLYIVLAMTPIAIARAGMFGSNSGSSLRYNVESSALLILVAMVAASTLRVARTVQAAAVVASAAVAAHLQMQSTKVFHAWDIAGTKAYVAALQNAVQALPADAVILIDTTPEAAVPAWLSPFNTTERFARLVKPGLQFAGPDRATVVIASDGHIEALAKALP